MDDQDCTYIDKQKLLTRLEQRRSKLIETHCNEPSYSTRMDLLCVCDELDMLISEIEHGVYDAK